MIRDFLFRNLTNKEKYCYFTLGDKWRDCFVVELCNDNQPPNMIYWGNTQYAEPDRLKISEFLTMAFLQSEEDDWELVSQKQVEMLPGIQSIIEKAKNNIENYNPNEKSA